MIHVSSVKFVLRFFQIVGPIHSQIVVDRFYRMEDCYKEICWNDTILKEATQLLPACYLSDDAWEQSQDTTSNTVLSRDSMETDFKAHDSCSIESESNRVTHDSAVEHVENSHVSPFCNSHADGTEGAEKKFTLLGESPKRRLGESSVESSPKRMNFGSSTTLNLNSSTSRSEIPNDSIDYKLHVVSMESLSKDNGKIYNLEECQVFPRVTAESCSENTTFDSKLKSDNCIEDTALLNINDDRIAANTVEVEKINFKPRQASIDSALDSGIGDSCNSVDSRDGKNDKEELSGGGGLSRNYWQPKIQKSLAVRLPGIQFLETNILYIYIYIGVECKSIIIC